MSLFEQPPEFYDFVKSHLYNDPADLVIKYAGKDLNFNLELAITQIINRKKTRTKLPSFISKTNFIFPDKISSEQSSDERVAGFHASIIGNDKRVVDLTAGLGIDAMTIGLARNKVTAIELDPKKADALQFNSKILGIDGFDVINSDCIEYINSINDYPDYFFIDPVRRNSDNKRTYSFKDCLPDITLFYKEILKGETKLLIKASPLLDIKAVITQLDYIHNIYIVSVKGECKELLIELGKDEKEEIKLEAIDLKDAGVVSRFSMGYKTISGTNEIVTLDYIKKDYFLYEPNAAVMKMNAGGELCKRYNLKKLGRNTELFISEEFHKEFPGRIIQIKRILSSSDLKKMVGNECSIVVRNYPLTADQLRKKLKAKESDINFIYGMRAGNENKPVLIEGKKIEV